MKNNKNGITHNSFYLKNDHQDEGFSYFGRVQTKDVSPLEYEGLNKENKMILKRESNLSLSKKLKN